MHAVADGVWQLSGWPPDAINVYRIEDVLIDTGTRWARRRLETQLKGVPLTLIALTHSHPDHQGSARALCQRFRVPLACHEADVDGVEGRRPLLKRENAVSRLLTPALAGPPARVHRVLRDGDTVAGFRVIHAPGHTPGHIFYFRDRDRLCIAGDVLANIHFVTGLPGLREPPWAFSHDPIQNRGSIKLLASLQPSLVCFGHGPPLRDMGQLQAFVQRLP